MKKTRSKLSAMIFRKLCGSGKTIKTTTTEAAPAFVERIGDATNHF